MTRPTGSIFTMLGIPAQWPPPQLVVLMTREKDNVRLELLADNLGRFGFHLAYKDVAELHMFQRVLFSGPGRLLLDCAWSDEQLYLGINGENLLRDQIGDGPIRYVALKPVDAPRNYGSLCAQWNPSAHLDPTDRMFIETIKDVDAKVILGTPYSLIRAGGLLRQLLLDGPGSLVDLVNRRHRKKLEFEVLDSPIKELRAIFDSKLETFWRPLDPEAFPGSPTLTLDRDHFLATEVLETASGPATVKDVIKACANSKGGIHVGQPTALGEGLVVNHDNENKVFDREPSLVTTAEICRVLLKGLSPLARCVCSGLTQQ